MSDYRHDLGDLNGASMKSRMGLVTVRLCALSAGSVPGMSGGNSEPSSSSSPQSSQTSTNDDDNGDIDSGDVDAENIVGDWTAAKSEWTVHFKSVGTFVEDFQCFEDFRVGRYTVKVDEVTLVGGDGYSDVGTIKDDGRLKFKLGTLTKEE